MLRFGGRYGPGAFRVRLPISSPGSRRSMPPRRLRRARRWTAQERRAVLAGNAFEAVPTGWQRSPPKEKENSQNPAKRKPSSGGLGRHGATDQRHDLSPATIRPYRSHFAGKLPIAWRSASLSMRMRIAQTAGTLRAKCPLFTAGYPVPRFPWIAEAPIQRRKSTVAIGLRPVFENLSTYQATTHFNGPKHRDMGTGLRQRGSHTVSRTM